VDRITFYVAEVQPDGSPTPAVLLAAYENELLDLAETARLMSGGLGEPGLTIFVNVMGVWRSPAGKTCREPMRLYCLDVFDAEPLMAEVRRVAGRMRSDLNQEVVYVTLSPVEATAVAELAHA
jgi:hypothetical protein